MGSVLPEKLTNSPSRDGTPWTAGRFDSSTGPPQLLFGRMYEDPEIEARAFPRGSQVFAIASAGCTAIRLALDHEVTAVDLNPVQLAYAQRRADGAPRETGAAERMMRRGRNAFPLIGWTRQRFDKFFAMRDTQKQIAYWKSTLDTQRFRRAFDTVTSQALLRLIYDAQFLARMPRRIGPVLRRRMERCWSLHPNATNPYARALFLDVAESHAEVAPRSMHPSALRFVCADAAAYLESCPSGSFNAFTMSNIFDGATPPYQARLIQAMKHAAAKEAIGVIRSFAEPELDWPANHAATDRSLLWGIVQIAPVSSL
jgi:S-adenosylmethionine:diacylglycerol 3-amino-3-carboxypropyl transferase